MAIMEFQKEKTDPEPGECIHSGDIGSYRL